MSCQYYCFAKLLHSGLPNFLKGTLVNQMINKGHKYELGRSRKSNIPFLDILKFKGQSHNYVLTEKYIYIHILSNNLAKYIYYCTFKRKLKLCETWFNEMKDQSSISVYIRIKGIDTSQIKWMKVYSKFKQPNLYQRPILDTTYIKTKGI